MSVYTITFSRSARKEIDGLPLPVAKRIFLKLGELDRNPRPRGCLKLRGPDELWRIRVGDYRVIYKIDDSARTVDIVYVRHRRTAYG